MTALHISNGHGGFLQAWDEGMSMVQSMDAAATRRMMDAAGDGRIGRQVDVAGMFQQFIGYTATHTHRQVGEVSKMQQWQMQQGVGWDEGDTIGCGGRRRDGIMGGMVKATSSSNTSRTHQ